MRKFKLFWCRLLYQLFEQGTHARCRNDIVFTCPECHGSLVRLAEGKLIRFRCHTGHAYRASSLLASVTESVEEMLWQSMGAMEETTMLLKNMGRHFEELKNPEAAKVFFGKAEKTARRAQTIHDSILPWSIRVETCDSLEGSDQQKQG